MRISVKTFRGVVQPSGFVDSAESVAKAGELTKGIEGVIETRNRL